MEFQSVSASIVYWFGISLASFLSFLFVRIQITRNKNQPLYHWPFLGSIPSMICSSHRLPEWISEIFFSLGKGFESFRVEGPVFSNMYYLITCHPPNFEYIFKTNPSNFTKGPQFKETFDIFGDGLSTVDAETWRFQRKLGHRAFTSMEFRRCTASSSLNLVETELVSFLDHAASEGSVIDLQDICTRFSFDCTIHTLFGSHQRHLSVDLLPNKLSQAFHDVHEALLLRHIYPKFWWKLQRLLNVGKERDYARAWKKIDILLEEYISQKKESFAKGEESTNDLLSIYIRYLEESPDDNKLLNAARMNKKFLRDVFISFFAAGKDAVGSGLTWFFWLVAKTPRVEEKILAELKMVAAKNKQGNENNVGTKWPLMFDSQDLDGLVYLHAAICESLRLCPPLHLIKRVVVQEDVLPDGSVVKPGMHIFLSLFAEGRMPWIWGEDSMEFKPERWIDDDGKLSHALTSKFFAFNVGPRTCLGRNTSFTEMKVAIAATLFNFRVHLVEDQPVCSSAYLSLHMKDGLLTKISKRTM